MTIATRRTLAALLPIWACAAHGADAVSSQPDPQQLPPVQVAADRVQWLETYESASSGVVTSQEISAVPLLRPADVMENIPGMVVTQHSGDGKANQYYLRGFNLDHGTDFATTIQGVPVNMPTNAHGQGYTDLNYLIPELVDRIEYRKGPYFAPNSDFSSAGSADIFYKSRLEQSFANLTLGSYGYQRALFAGSTELNPSGLTPLGQGMTLLGAFEAQRADGPWTTKEALQKTNALLRLTDGTVMRGWSIDATLYDANWNATDQVPLRLLEKGKIDRYSGIDTSDGGKTSRQILGGEWHTQDADGYMRANAFFQHYTLTLWSNFTYFASNPVLGDQFQQSENRNFTGATLLRGWNHKLFDRDSTTEAGLQFRYDNIRVSLANSYRRIPYENVTDDQVNQSLSSAYIQNTTNWTPWMRTVLGARFDYINMGSTSFIEAENSGNATGSNVAPKFSLILGPWARTKFFLNVGGGIHSNDARGVIYKVDPTSGLPG